jgi:hypothetical protein
LLDPQVAQLGDRAAAKHGLHVGRDVMYRRMAHPLNNPFLGQPVQENPTFPREKGIRIIQPQNRN